MPDTGFFRASSFEISGGSNTTGLFNLILDGEGQFNTDIVGGDPTTDPLTVTLKFTDFFIPENNRVTGIEFILEGQANTGNFVNIPAPTISAGIQGTTAQISSPTPSNVLGVQAGNLTLTYSPANHTYTMDSIYAAINDPDLSETAINSNIDNANTINQIVGNTSNRVVKLAITLDALTPGINTLTLVGANGASPLPAIRIFYEKTIFTKVKIQTQPDIFEDDLVIPGPKTKIKLPSTSPTKVTIF